MLEVYGNRFCITFLGIRMKFKINNYFSNKVYVSKNGNLKRIFFAPKGVDITLQGKNAEIILPSEKCFHNVKIITNSNSKLQIETPHKWGINNLTLEMGCGNKIHIMENFNIVSGVFSACLEETAIIIGKDCMFSSGINLMTHDGHTVFDVDSKKALNEPQSIVVGNHCWFGKNVSFLKGAKVQENTIVGINSVVNKNFEQSNVVLAGNPAKIVKTNVNWDRNSYSGYVKAQEGKING